MASGHRLWFSLLLIAASSLTFLHGQTAAPAAASATAQNDFRALDGVVEDALAHHDAPGAVVIVGHNGQVVYRKAFGMRSLEPAQEAMTTDTVFDLASLSKVVATAPAMMILYQQGKFRLNDPVSRYLPEFTGDGKDEITIRQLMTHYSGFGPDLALEPYWEGKAEAERRIWAEKPVAPPGARFLYSDINFETLGLLVERLSGMTLDEFARKKIYQPLGMMHTGFRPIGSATTSNDVSNNAPTEWDARTGKMLRGVVHDPTARRMGGVAGHAGVFSTADDLAIYCQAMLDILSKGRAANGAQLFSKLTAEKMTTPQNPPTATDLRGLGWDIDTPFSADRGELLPVGSFGHTGFTGTSIHIDPFTQTYLIVLTNAVHPHVGKAVTNLRVRAANAVAEIFEEPLLAAQARKQFRITGYNEANAGARRPVSRNGSVQTGIDVLEAHNFAELSGKRIGLLTNQTGIDSKGQRTVDVLAHAPGVKLTMLFSPEHGAIGAVDTTEIGNSKDAATALPIYSVYGDSDAKRRPSPELLKQLDAVVIDLQDAGVRFYTYETTMGYFLEAAGKAGIEVIVLDRPNPISLPVVQGPVADENEESFVSFHTLPVRHGMTMGELARMFNTERQLNAKLTVIAMTGYEPGDWFDATGLEWINPSPNLRDLSEATLYPGVALIEGTNVSVGRGTDTPFEVVGAPWIVGRERELSAYLNHQYVSGVRFYPLSFTPASGPFKGEKCGGINITLMDRYHLDAPFMGIAIASALHKLFPEQFRIDKMEKLVANKQTLDALKAGTDPHVIADLWREGIEQFKQRRKPFQMYAASEK